MGRFAGKTVIVTGAASGIGAAAVRRFLGEGANVVAFDLSGEKLAALARDLPVDRFVTQTGDAANAEDIQATVDLAVDRFGRIDVLINNAGTVTFGDVTETSIEEWNRVMTVNVTGYFLMAKTAMPELRKHKGAIVMTSSLSGLGGDPHLVAYNTSKGAVTNMVRAMAIDHAPDGVRVNAVNPTFTRTGMTEEMQEDTETVAKFVARIPMGRPGEPDDLAKAMLFLASDEAGFITGVNLPVDGGSTASSTQAL
ncbi:SDR family NAD(P)-dependent oxidoreductase [Stakelama tenebrarum]|uniref:SDR family oxidoreductase n=1 Tax=Stakelama tenebrarum TaxID=2711215 RepID=A0A6G6Y827_9SPHN|nr:SDR family oxidoreductase [Sphingosinithalassobacter tenebrarum]QIG81094.1 SDR family oxidoreductase [Sphingosinithalassobacter tenebrarum]